MKISKQKIFYSKIIYSDICFRFFIKNIRLFICLKVDQIKRLINFKAPFDPRSTDSLNFDQFNWFFICKFIKLTILNCIRDCIESRRIKGIKKTRFTLFALLSCISASNLSHASTEFRQSKCLRFFFLAFFCILYSVFHLNHDNQPNQEQIYGLILSSWEKKERNRIKRSCDLII